MKSASKTVSFLIEVTATVDAKMVRDHYGVPGSPEWMSPTNEVVRDDLDFAGEDVHMDALPESLADLVWEIAVNAASNTLEGWEYE